MAKLNLKKYIKIEKDAVYALQFNYQPSLEEIQAMQSHFEKVYKETGAKFIILGNNLKLLSPTKLSECPELIEQIELLFNKALKNWQNNMPRIVAP